LKRLDALTERLTILDLPDTSVYKEVVGVSNISFASTLHEAVPHVSFRECDLKLSSPYEGFVDSIHVNSKGRQYLTAELVLILTGQSENMLCRAAVGG